MKFIVCVKSSEVNHRNMDKRKSNTGLSSVILTLALILATFDLTSTTYITLTRDGYQNVVVSIEENSGFSNCQEGLDSVKVNFHCQLITRPNSMVNLTNFRNWSETLQRASVKLWQNRLTLVMSSSYFPIHGQTILLACHFWRQPTPPNCPGPEVIVLT